MSATGLFLKSLFGVLLAFVFGLSGQADAGPYAVEDLEALCQRIDHAQIRFSDSGEPILSPDLLAVLDDPMHPCRGRLIARLAPTETATTVPGETFKGYP
jgi:hypothetical protein